MARDQDKSRRWLLLLAATLMGVIVGLASDYAVDRMPLSLADAVGGVLLSPIIVTVGGGVVGSGVVRSLFVVGGLLFWPVYVLSAWRWLQSGSVWLLAFLGSWSVQGFMMIQHRLGLVMSA